MTSEIRANKQTNRAGLGTVTYTDTGIIVSGIVTCTELSGLTALNISGVGTASTLDINGDIDVDGHTNLDNLSVAGVTSISTGYLGLPSDSLIPEGTFLVKSGQRIIGLGAHNNISWIQATNPGGSGLAAPLSLNPSGGNIGIGMTIPEVRLHVQGSGNEIAHFTGANNAELKLRNSNSNILFVYSGTGDTLQVGTGGQNVAITIDTNQNIATQGLSGYSFNNDSSNAKIFEVTGTGSEGKYGVINISGNTNSNNGPAGSLRFINRENSSTSSAGSANSKALAGIQAYAVTTDSNAGNDSGGYLTFLTKGDGGNFTTRAVLSETGHFGLNDTSPDTRLSVRAATGTDVVAKFTSTDQYSWIQFRDNSTTDTGVMIGASGDNLLLRAGSNERIRILSSGETCIRDVDLILGYDQNTHAALNFFANADNASGRYARIRKNYNSPFFLEYFASTSASPQSHVFYSDLTTERLRITSDGRLFVNSTAVVNTDDFLTIKRPVGSTAVTSMTLDATTTTQNNANALIFTKSKDYYYNGIIFTSSTGHQGGICGKMNAAGGTTPQIDFRVGGSGFNSSDTLAMIIHNGGNITINENLAVGGSHPWSVTGGNYGNISISGGDANSSGFLNLGNGAATNNADFDLARIKFFNGGTEVATIKATTATSDNGDADIKFFTKKAGSGAKEILRIRNDGFVETMYSENTGSYSLSTSPTPRLRIRNDYGGDGIISAAQFYAKRGSGAASIFNIGVITTSQDYESNLIIQSRNTDASYSEKIRIEAAGQIRMNYGDNAKQAYALRSTFRTITGHSSTGYQYIRCALLAARTAYRVCVNTTGGNYGPGAQFFTVLRNWDSTTLYVSDKFNMGSAYANAVRLQSDNGGGDWYMEISINLTTTSQGFGLSVIPIGNNAGTMTTNLQYYGSGMSNLTATSSAHSL